MEADDKAAKRIFGTAMVLLLVILFVCLVRLTG